MTSPADVACSYRGVESILRHRLDETAAEPLARTERSDHEVHEVVYQRGPSKPVFSHRESEVFNCEETTQGLLHWR